MLKFTKSYINNKNTKIATDYKKITDLQKLDEIRKRLHPEQFNVNNNCDHKQIVDNLKRIKKD